MCGIVGYIGKSVSISKVIKGLKNLEYRGYDSAGIAYINKNDELVIEKDTGRIANLEKKLKLNDKTSLAISHTRWATHGKPNAVNAHPHRIGSITLVHNGILENYQELKYELLNEGVKFSSQTDTEVIAAVINSFYEKTKDIKKAIQEFIGVARGSYALGIIVDNDDNLYVAKKENPLIMGITDDGYYIASDVPAILEYTNKYIIFNDYEYGVISKDDVNVYDKEGNEVQKEIKVFESSADAISKNGFEHFMLKEIFEEESVCKETFNYYLNNLILLPDLNKYNHIDIVGCGSTYNVALVGKVLIEQYLDIPVNVDIASEYRYKSNFVDKDSLVIFISQSGETADTLAALKKVKKQFPKTIGIVNVYESSIAREVDEVIYTKAGIEIAVATTKAYLSQLIVLVLTVLKSAVSKNNITEEKLADINEEIKKLPKYITELLNNREVYQKIAKEIYKKENIYYIGRSIDYSLCLEASLKLKEISYIHCEAYPAGELKHGTISLIEKGTPVIGIITDQFLKEKTVSNLEEVESRGAKVIIISTEDLEDFSKLIVKIPKTDKLLQSILTIIPIQLIAYETAKLRECDIDKPKNLAKSVTVE